MRLSLLIKIMTGLAVAATAGVPTARAHQPLPVGCDAIDPDACRYESDLNYPAAEVDAIINDPIRLYDLPVKVRYPVGAVGPRPIVIWHHGGNPSLKGRGRSEEWGRLLAQAGYVVIHPSRMPYPNLYQGFEQDCLDNDVQSITPAGLSPQEACSVWVAQHVYGPQNTHFIIDNLHLVEGLDPALNGLLDSAAIVVAGHSAGTGAVLSNAGVVQQWHPAGAVYSERNDAPVAFLVVSPIGTTLAGWHFGFRSTGYQPIERPMMTISGIGDETGEPAEARAAPWLNSVPGNKLLAWNMEREAKHETMNLRKCDTPVQQLHCEWIGPVGLAYIDSVTRNRQEAIDWLKSNALEVLSSGEIELHRR